jgi:exonuclease SbcD
MHIIITAGNHDSPSRLESPRELLTIMNMQIRGNVKRNWIINENNTSKKIINYDDLIIPICNQNNEEAIILAVPYLRNDSVQGSNYSEGVNNFLRELTNHARQLHPNKPIIMMAHMYAKGADIATKDASEKIIIGGLEEVDMSNWENHPDYLTCGHIHKRQHIWGTEWARYTGSVLPMSFAEKDYSHGIDCIIINDNNSISVEKLTYTPQHRLRILPENEEALTFAKLKKLINT